MLHSINALRVVGEFFVVKYHLFPSVNKAADSNVPMVLESLAAVDLMSFFFVLSGFVCAYAHKGDDWTVRGCWMTFYRRKAAKMYPIYLLGLAVNIATRSATYDPWFWGCLVADVAVVSPWTYCMNSCDARQAAWYLSVLFWLWLAFPPLQQLTCLQRHPWITVICLYCISLIPWFYLVVHPWEYVAYSQLPICRLAEFLIGCTLTSTLHTRVSTWLCALVCMGVGSYYIIELLVFPYHMSLCMGTETRIRVALTPWTFELLSDGSARCPPIWHVFRSRMALAWAIVIQWVACTELQGGSTLFLGWGLFKDLSRFSLQLYLGHGVCSGLLVTCAQSLGPVKNLLQMDTLMLGTYSLCYVLYVYLQPLLDRAGKYVFQHTTPNLIRDVPDVVHAATTLI